MTNYPLLQYHWEKMVEQLLEQTLRFPTSQRFVFSNRLNDLALDGLLQTVGLESLPQRQRHKIEQQLDRHLSRLQVLLRMCHKRRLLSNGQLEQLSRQLACCWQHLGTRVQ